MPTSKEYILKNDNIVTVTSNELSTINTSVLNEGFQNENGAFLISGRVPHNKPTVIGKVKVEAGTHAVYAANPGDTFTALADSEKRRFIRTPDLKSITNALNLDSNTLRLKLTKTIYDTKSSTDPLNYGVIIPGKNIIAFEYDLIYKASSDVSISSNVKFKLNLKSKKIPTEKNGLISLSFGKTEMGRLGSKRKITINGSPYHKFQIAITKFNDSIDTTPGRLGEIIEGSSEQSILSKTDPKVNWPSAKTDVNPDGVALRATYKRNSNGNYSVLAGGDEGGVEVLLGKTGTDGKFTFVQEFPSVSSQTRYGIHVSSLISQAYHGVDDTFNTEGWEVARPGWKNWYSKIITQFIDPVVTLTVTTASLLYSINSQAIPGSGIQTYSNTYTGRPNASRDSVKDNRGITTSVRLTYLLDSSDTKTFGTARSPVFNKTIEYTALPDATPSSKVDESSDWTNTIPSLNGGTELEIGVISLSATGAETITLVVQVNIQKFGNKNVAMVLDLDDVIAPPS